MNRWRRYLAFSAVLALASVAAHATPDPCFEFVCENLECDFDASCSTELDSNTVWKIFWDFGDEETNLGWTVAPSHEYELDCYHLVEMELWLWTGGTVDVSCWVIPGDPSSCPGPPVGSTSGMCN